MFGTPCFNLQERLVPHVRAETARRLAQQGLRQNRIAEHLGVSQAMVSKYVKSKIPAPKGVPAPFVARLVDDSVTRVLEDEQKGTVAAWCPVCPQFSAPASKPGPLEECLRGPETASKDETQAVLANLVQAAADLRSKRFADLAPQVQVNIAMCVPDARDARGVAAFPGRLVEVRNELRSVADPEFGASSHLSRLLLDVRGRRPNVRAILCIRYGADIERAFERARLVAVPLRRKGTDLHTPPRLPAAVDAFVDPGDFGIEPITYMLGETALDAVKKTDQLLEHLLLRNVNPR